MLTCNWNPQHFIRNMGEWLSGQFVAWMQSRDDFFETIPVALQSGFSHNKITQFKPFLQYKVVYPHCNQRQVLLLNTLVRSLSRIPKVQGAFSALEIDIWPHFRRKRASTICRCASQHCSNSGGMVAKPNVCGNFSKFKITHWLEIILNLLFRMRSSSLESGLPTTLSPGGEISVFYLIFEIISSAKMKYLTLSIQIFHSLYF